MRVTVAFYSYFKDLTGCSETSEELLAGSTLGDLLGQLAQHFPKLGPMQNSVLSAVGVDYQDRSYRLQEGDRVALFPPVQGG
jgi:molybdopterin converting factor small subunit